VTEFKSPPYVPLTFILVSLCTQHCHSAHSAFFDGWVPIC
jgi:hypothetical protein